MQLGAPQTGGPTKPILSWAAIDSSGIIMIGFLHFSRHASKLADEEKKRVRERLVTPSHLYIHTRVYRRIYLATWPFLRIHARFFGRVIFLFSSPFFFPSTIILGKMTSFTLTWNTFSHNLFKLLLSKAFLKLFTRRNLNMKKNVSKMRSWRKKHSCHQTHFLFKHSCQFLRLYSWVL